MNADKPIHLGQLLDLLGYEDGELFQLATKPVGGAFSATVQPLSEAAGVDLAFRPRCDYWFGVNPVIEVQQGRPGADHVTRLAGIWADLDVKTGGCPTMAHATRIVDELAAMVGTRPVAVTRSGHGLQPIWAIEDGALADEPSEILMRHHARALLRRWGRLVATVAERFESRVDTVFDLPRILRVPNSVNWKSAPVPVVTHAAGGAPIAVERLLEVLDEFGIADLPEDHDDPGTIVSAPAEWAWAARTCGYAELTMQGWARDEPNDRHPWLVAQATRIAAMHRNGCLTEFDHSRAVERLVTRFRVLLARSGVGREPGRGEISDALGWGQQRAAAMPAGRLGEELGNHAHKERITDGKHERDNSVGHASAGIELGSARNGHDQGGTPAVGALPRGQGPDQFRMSMGSRPTLRTLIRQAEASEAPAATVQQPAEGPAEPETPEQKQLRLDVEDAARRLRVATEAKAIERARQASGVVVPKPVPLGEFLARPMPAIKYRIGDGDKHNSLLRVGGRAMVTAQYKAGKSTMMGNLIRSLADGDPFLGRFTVAVPAGQIVLIDDELDEDTLQDWLSEQGVRNTHKVQVISLRGQVATFDLTNESIRAEWARNLKEVNCAFLIFDCLRPVLDALGLSEDKESGHFLVSLDALARDAGIAEMAVVHHMGHGSERARGDSRLRDWPDSEWKIVRDSTDEDDPAAPKYFKAFGRGVDVKEGRLELEGVRLQFKAGEKRQKGRGKVEIERIPVEPAVEDILRTSTKPLSKHQIELALRAEGHGQKPIREALERLIGGGLIKVQPAGKALMCQWSEGA